MQCNLPSFDQLKSLVKNRKAFLPRIDNPTQADTLRALDFTQSHFGLSVVGVSPKDKGDDKRRYTLKDEQGTFAVNTFMNWRVSDRINKLFRRGKTEAAVETIRQNPDNILKREFGSHVHNIMEQLGTHFHNNRNNETPDQIWQSVKSSEYKLTKDQFDVLQKNMKKLVADIKRQQRLIDKNGTVDIRFEQVLVDPIQDVGGTMDIVAVFSDNTALIYDFKTMSPWEDYIKGVGKNRTLVSNDFISQSKREQWKLQMSAYRRILLTHYGVKEVRGSRIIPIWLDFNRTKDNLTNEYRVQSSVNQIQMGEEMSEHLRTILAGYEKTGIVVIDKFLKSQYTKLDQLYKSLSAAERTERAAIGVEIRNVERSIQNFLEKTEMEDMIQYMYQLAINVQDRLNKNEDIPDTEVNQLIDYFEGISAFQQGMAQNSEVLSVQVDPEFTKTLVDELRQFNEHITSINQVLGSLTYYRLDTILSRIGDQYGTIRRQGSEILLDDDAYLRKLFLSGSESSNPFVRYALNRIQEKYGQLRLDLTDLDTRIDKVEQAAITFLKSKGESLADIHKYLLDEVGNFHRELSLQFYQLRKQARETGDTKFFTKYMEIKPTNAKGETYSQWYNRTVSELQVFLEERFAHIKSKKGDKAFYDKIQSELQNWKVLNDLTLDRQGNPIQPEAWMKSHWLIPNATAKAEFISDAYRIISSNPALKDYYHTMLDIVSEMRSIAGYDIIKSYNFFPKVRADMLEKLSRSEFSAIRDDLTKVFSIREDEQGYGNYNIATGEFEKSIPMFFTNPLMDANGEPSTAQMSKDIGASMRLFGKVVYNYKYMNEVEGEVLAVKEILPTLKYIKRDGKGNLQFDQHHNVAVKDRSEGADTTEKVFAAYVDYYLYGIHTSSSIGSPNFTKTVLQLRNYFSIKTLGLGFIGGTASYVAARTSAWMEGQKGILYTPAQWTEATKDMVKDSKKYHGLAYFFGVHNNNMLESIVQGRTRALLGDKLYASKAQQYVNSRMLLRPYSYGDERLDNHIAVSMAKNYGVDEFGNIKRLENLPAGSTSIWDMFTYSDTATDLTGLTEEQLKKVLVQFRAAVRSGQKGVKGTMSEEDIAYSSTDLLLSTMMQFKSWMPGILTERFGKLRYNEIVDAPVWGRYKAFWSELTSTEMEQSAKTSMFILEATARAFGRFGRMLLKNNGLARKLGSEYVFDEKRLEVELADYRHKSGDSRITLDQYKKIKAGQIRAMVSEIEILVLFTSMVVMLGADWNDDGEPLYKDNWVFHQLYKVLNRTKTELAFTYAPSEYAKLISSPIPLAGLALQAERLISNTLDEAGDTMFGEKTERFPIPFGKNKGKDERNTFYYTLGLIPGGNNLRNLFSEDAVR